MCPVSVVRCDGYRRDRVLAAVERSIDLIGGLGAYIAPGSRVLVKPNILQATSPDDAVCTHPDVVYAVCKLLRQHGCSVVIAESPGAGSVYGPVQLRKAYEIVGYASFADELGVELNDDVSYEEVANPDGRLIKRFLLIGPARKVDAIVVVSKLKTHLFTGMTCATKNAFGLIPGMEKATFHGRLPDPMDFGRMLVDLNELVRPSLEIVDAVVGMEGDGPYSGRPRAIGAILASDSYAEVDLVAARLIGIGPEAVPTIVAALERGKISALDAVRTVGDELDALIVKDFQLPSTYKGGRRKPTGRLLSSLMKLAKIYALRPRVTKERCTNCGRCVSSCPVQTILVKRGKAHIKLGRCIRCYTCHEMCTSNAIRLDRSLTGRLLVRMLERRNG